MKLESELKLQAYLDGELSPRQARKVSAWLAQDQEAQQLFAELKNTKTALAGCDLAGRFVAYRSGHRLNAEMLRAMFASTSALKRCA